jgi:hypothetical protein
MDDGQGFTTDTARRAAADDDLGGWVARFLASPGSDNAELADLLAERPRWWIGPVKLPIDQLHRLAGPSDQPVLEAVDDDYWRDDVEEMAERAEQGWEPPPVVVTHRDDQLVLEDGNHRVEGLRRAGVDEAWAVVSFLDPGERDRFLAAHEG